MLFGPEPVWLLKDMGQTRGLEPPNTGTTNRCLNHLATPAIPEDYVSTLFEDAHHDFIDL